MADFVCNIAKGAVAEKIRDGANLILLVYDAGASTDDARTDAVTVTAFLAISGVVERTTNGWTRKTVANGSVTLTVDHTNNRVDVDIPDQTWTGPTSGAVTDILVAEDAGGADGTRIPLTNHDFPITPDGSDVVAQIAAAGFYRAS